jgi:hypothetical protein
MPKTYRLRFMPFKGLDLNTVKIRMDEGAAQISRNFDYGAPPGTRIRAGYSRLLDGITSNAVESAGQPSMLFAFERDDDVTRLIIAHSGSMDQYQPGGTEWT